MNGIKIFTNAVDIRISCLQKTERHLKFCYFFCFSCFLPSLDLCFVFKTGALYFLFGFSDSFLDFLCIRLRLGFVDLFDMLYFAIDLLCISADLFLADFLCMLYLAADLFRICIKFLFVSIELLFAGFLCLFPLQGLLSLPVYRYAAQSFHDLSLSCLSVPVC